MITLDEARAELRRLRDISEKWEHGYGLRTVYVPTPLPGTRTEATVRERNRAQRYAEARLDKAREPGRQRDLRKARLSAERLLARLRKVHGRNDPEWSAIAAKAAAIARLDS